MRLVVCMRTRDQAELVDALVAFHLNAGADFVLATDHRSRDGTLELLEAWEREGCLRLFRESGERVLGSAWRTRMARLAAAEHGANWVLHCDGDEFWWPRGRSSKEVLEAVPERYGAVRGLWRTFVPCATGDAFFAERMTIRLAPAAAINEVGTPYRPNAKIAHRAEAGVVVDRGAHRATGDRLRPLPGWYPFEVLHFPVRSPAQLAEKYGLWASQLATTREVPYPSLERATADGLHASLAVDDLELARGLGEGSLVVDTRLRDVLRALRRDGPGPRRYVLPSELESPVRLPRPGLGEDAACAVDAANLHDAQLLRLQRRVDELETALAALST